MSVHSRALAIFLLCGCAQRSSGGATPSEPAPVEREPVSVALGTGSGSGPPDARTLYEGCRDRVEGTETDHECIGDADCVRTGCSSELCIAQKDAAGVMSTCEVRTCFQVLESCTCQEGHCRWVVGAAKEQPGGGPGSGAMDVQ